eukprot:symbB.v1.2.026271.t1/scaffold2600.1/size76924/2
MFFSAVVNAEGIGGAVACENGIEKFRIGLNFRPLGAAKTLLKAVEGWMLFEGHSVAELVPWALIGFFGERQPPIWAFDPGQRNQCPTGIMKKDLHNPPLGLPRGPVVEREVAINNAADQGLRLHRKLVRKVVGSIDTMCAASLTTRLVKTRGAGGGGNSVCVSHQLWHIADVAVDNGGFVALRVDGQMIRCGQEAEEESLEDHSEEAEEESLEDHSEEAEEEFTGQYNLILFGTVCCFPCFENTMADEDEATARRRPWHSVYIVLGQELPFDLVLQTCLDVLGRSFLRSWPGGPQEMEDSLRRGVEESGAGPVAHGLRRSQAQELSGRLAPFVATQVNVNRAAAEAASRESPQISSRGYLIGASRIEPPPEAPKCRHPTFDKFHPETPSGANARDL